ncbi:TPA: restriction endonuclease subunit S [Staphylococcus aureus]|uniref:restriction endonuclease subunit S n=1 Tax=Staphylococcus TaxID=1279 RepID=UPI000B2EB152|nr:MULTISPECIES: restriction endonuclease subunit S [Staphylococcus]KAA2273711.1 restriction endonuclease subunit S [Staphylococcus sp. GDX7P312P]KAA2278207.1 restriction endonuclease subunit S [Staphylococcus sp. GDX7P459A]MDU0434930.1 restriction endonuclease subunit S [Staphylococcus haemolyticus]HCT7698784.1 restriction endonuclease subunit S [Staphylococcus aureus]
MIEQTNTPKLRFPEFKNEWSYDLLSDVVTNKSKKFDPKKEEATKDIELDSIEQNTGRLLDTYISNDFTSQKNKFKKGNVLYSKLRPYLNKYYYATIDGVCSSEIWVLNTLNKDVLVNKFLYYFIQTNRFSSVTNKSAGSKMPRADWELVKNIRLYKGSIKEQEKIGYFFSKLDQHIELEEKKLKLLEQQKKGYIQKIFSQELRFKDENGNNYPNWEMKKLGNIANIVGGGTPSTKKSEYWDGDINWFSPVEIGDKEFVSTSQRRITEKGLEKSSAKMLPIGTVLFTSRAGIGKTAILSKEATTNQGFQSIVPKENDLDSYFLYSMTSILKRNAEKVGAGSTFSEVSRKQMEQIKLLIPILKEQKQIARLFQIINRKINKQIHKIELLKQRKKGLLQKMFV